MKGNQSDPSGESFISDHWDKVVTVLSKLKFVSFKIKKSQVGNLRFKCNNVYKAFSLEPIL